MKNKKIINYIVIIGLILIIGWGSYAFFSYSKVTNNNNLIMGDIYMKLVSVTNNITLTNNFPETRESAILRNDNYIDFKVQGINEFTDPIIYQIVLEYADVPTGYESTDRMYDKDIMIELTDTTSGEILVSDSFQTINERSIFVRNIESTETMVEHNYRLRVWYRDDILISDTDSNKTYCSSSYCDDDTLKIFNELFSSIKVKVYGDFNEKSTNVWLSTLSNEEKTYFNSLTLQERNNIMIKEGIERDIALMKSDGTLVDTLERTLNCVIDKQSTNSCNYSNVIGYTMPIYLEDYGTHYIRVSNETVDDDLESNSASGIVIEFADILFKDYIDSDNTNEGGWESSDIRTTLNTTVYNSIPSKIRDLIINTTVVSSHGSIDTDNFTTTDKLYLLSSREVWNEESTADSASTSTRQLDYYNLNNDISESPSYSGSLSIIKKYNGVSSYWWFRTAKLTSSVSYYGADDIGAWFYMNSNYQQNGISPAFRISN